jgi:pimeloyl-ACP methyl ester carboxylesterase
MAGSFLSLLIVLLLVGALVCAAAVVVMAYGLVRPPRMTDGKALYLLGRVSPAELGLAFEDMAFDVREEPGGRVVRIVGWWIPARHPDDRSAAGANGDGAHGGSNRCVVLLHGYADARVGAIAWAPVWRELGWNVLAIDLRAHGQSGGRYVTAGRLEREDVGQVINQLRAARPGETREVALFGVSLGAAVAAATGVARADVGDVAAVVLESPYADFRDPAAAQMQRLGVPRGAILRAALGLAGWMTGTDFAALRVDRLIERLPCPVMVIAPAEDPYVSSDDTAALERAVASRAPEAGPGVFWRVPGAGHGMALVDQPEEYRTRLGAFLDAALAWEGASRSLRTSDGTDAQIGRKPSIPER